MVTPAFLVRLMAHTSLSRALKLGPEDREAYSFANELRVATLQGRLTAAWTHPANELAGFTHNVNGKYRVPVQVAMAKALGLITGASDYWFVWKGGSGFIEFKSDTGSLSQPQRDFRAWAQHCGVPYAVARSSAEGLAILREWGVLA